MYISRMLPVGNSGGGRGRRRTRDSSHRQALYLPLASLPRHDGLRLVHQAGRQGQVRGGGGDGGGGAVVMVVVMLLMWCDGSDVGVDVAGIGGGDGGVDVGVDGDGDGVGVDGDGGGGDVVDIPNCVPAGWPGVTWPMVWRRWVTPALWRTSFPPTGPSKSSHCGATPPTGSTWPARTWRAAGTSPTPSPSPRASPRSSPPSQPRSRAPWDLGRAWWRPSTGECCQWGQLTTSLLTHSWVSQQGSQAI